jgi:hypothetical protein
MRRFSDETGSPWDATLGRESWGTFVILFTRATGGEVRKAVLAAETMLDAQQELEALAEQELRGRLATSQPWTGG